MAAKNTKASKGEAKERSSAAKLLLRVRDRHKVMTEADQDNRRAALEDLRFANEPGAQWDAAMLKERGERPAYEFNKCRINGKRVINEIRANRPQGKVRAVEGGDKDTAELYEGLCRNIANVSDFDTITDQAAEYQTDAGMAVWRVVTEYSDDDAFDQDILIKGIKNPFCWYVDPSCQDALKRDADDWMGTERISRRSYESRWPNAEPVEFGESEDLDDEDEWEDAETIRICEYWYKEPYEKEVWLVEFAPSAPGQEPERKTVDASSDEAPGVQAMIAQGLARMLREPRKVRTHKIKMCIASGDAILEQADWAGSQFPFVMVYGEYKVIDGKSLWWGLHRFAKDAQRSYNMARTAIDETIALAPQAKWWATAKQAEGLTKEWARAHKQNLPWLPYNADPAAQDGAPPQRMPGADVPSALMQQAAISAQDIRDVTGLHEASFGEESGEKSGIALARKQRQAQIVTYNFPDNMAKAIKRTWEILIDLIPHIYDAERELRVIGADGAEDYARINQIVQDPQTGQAIRVNDLSVGKYDVTVTTGPSFSTLRQEAAETYGEIVQQFPQAMAVAGDLLFKSMDLPYSDEIAKRMQTLLPPPIQQQLAEGKDIPPEAQAVMAQANQAMQMVQQQTQLVQQAAQEVQQEQAKSEKAKAEVEKALANLKAAEAQFEAKVAKVESQFVQREAQLGMQSVQIDGAKQQLDGRAKSMQLEEKFTQERQNAAGSELSAAQQAVQQIDGYVAQFMEAFAKAMSDINSVMAEIKSKPRVKSIRAERVGGQLRAVPEYENEPAAQ